MSGLDGIDMKALAEILREESSSSSEDERPNAGLTKLGPSDIGKSSKARTKIKSNTKPVEKRLPVHPDDIWDINDVDLVHGDDVLSDPRDRPEFDVVYKQKVCSEDMFLQLGQKTPMSSSCEMMIVKVKMIGEAKDDIECDVTEKDVNVRSQLYRLHLPLPHAVNADTAKVEWDSTISTLVLTLEIVRDLDFINF